MKYTIMNCRIHCFTLSTALACTSTLIAGTETWFQPITESAEVEAPNALEEVWAPWALPDGITQFNLLSLQEIGSDPEQSVVNHQLFYSIPAAAGLSASMIDMLAYDPTGNFLFMPHETAVGAGVSRHDISERKTEVLFNGDFNGFFTGNWSNDWGAFDPCRFTPNGTLLLGEEWNGQGRVMEVLNPFADLEVEEIEIRELHSIANVSHEGINFSKKFDDVIYFIDEYNSGSIYKFVMSEAGDYTKGQTFVLSVDAFASSGGFAADDWNTLENSGAERTGLATWVPLTDAEGDALPGITDPFRNGSPVAHDNPAVFGGRPAADDAGGTPYGRPEDTEVGLNRRQKEVLYFTATSENTVYSVEMLPPGKKNSKAFVRVFLNQADTPKNQGFDPTTAVLNSPDNLAQDALGNIYVIEDAPNSGLIGGDVWFARDTDNDGVAESLDHFMSIRVAGCEAPGMVFNPVNPTEFVMAVQHPDSTNLNEVEDGFGDAVWRFDISQIDNQDFLKKLEKAAKVADHKDRG
jgi:hypothetical protein